MDVEAFGSQEPGVRDESPVGGAIHALDVELVAIGQLVDELTERLRPVLTEVQKDAARTPGNVSASNPCESHLVTQLRVLSAMAARTRNALIDCRDRLEV